jgi:hypothetical protein
VDRRLRAAAPPEGGERRREQREAAQIHGRAGRRAREISLARCGGTVGGGGGGGRLWQISHLLVTGEAKRGVEGEGCRWGPLVSCSSPLPFRGRGCGSENVGTITACGPGRLVASCQNECIIFPAYKFSLKRGKVINPLLIEGGFSRIQEISTREEQSFVSLVARKL